MEFCDRGSLFQVLANESIELPWTKKKSLILGLAQGMEYLHSQTPIIIHRDLKSLNVLVSQDWRAKVTDFGLSRAYTESANGKLTMATGSYHWMAVEVISGTSYTEKADVYSFGIILWETLTRRTPYDGMQAVQVISAVVSRNERPAIPEGTPAILVTLLNELWHANPGLRPPFRDIVPRIAALPDDL
mmetsp:Transcript_14559/g.49305  ORF Transcript_14559/g.49305 Transcript_14559/m.49305 type:complete len:188 (-) Transcript_14559:36-599(-)